MKVSKRKRRKKRKTVRCEVCGRVFDEDILTLRLFGITVCLDCLSSKTSEEIKEIAERKRKWNPYIPVIVEMMSNVEKEK